MTTRRERPQIRREASEVETYSGDLEPVGHEVGPPLEGRARAERFTPEAPPVEPDAELPYIVGTCRICQLGGVVLVRRDHSRRESTADIRALCLFCNRDLDPHEVEPRP